MPLLADRTGAAAVEAETMLRLWMRRKGITPRPNLPPPHPAQQRVLDAARRFNVLVCGRRWGKTQLLVSRLVEPALDGFPTAWFAPDYKRVDEPMRAVIRAVRRLTSAVNKTDRRIELVTGGVMEFWTLDSAGPGRGRKYKRVEIDEAGLVPDLDEKWSEDIRPTLTDLGGGADFGGTPRGFNFFHTLHDRGRKGMAGDERYADWASWQFPTVTNPYINPAEVEAARGDLSAEAFMQEYEAQFVSGATQIFLPAWWLGGLNRYDAAALVEHPTRISGRYVFWDTALKDRDENAYSARVVAEVTYAEDPNADGLLLVREVWRGRPQVPALVDEITASARAWNYDGRLERVVIEDKASGTSAVQTIRASAPAWLAERVSAFEPSGSKVERWNKAAVWCKRGCVRLPMPDDRVPWRRDFEDELFALPFSQFKDQGDAFAELILYLEHILEAGWRRRAGDGTGEEAA
jgi:phage terminase large subunit-like protein